MGSKDRKKNSDRFIPSRKHLNVSASQYLLTKTQAEPHPTTSNLIKFYKAAKSERVIKFNPSNLQDEETFQPKSRFVPKAPYKILDAPGIVDDFYLNLLDWSKSNIVSISLLNTNYLYNVSKESVTELCTIDGDEIYSHVKYIDNSRLLSLGSTQGIASIFDISEEKLVRSINVSHSQQRLPSCSYSGHIVSYGTRTGQIANFDLRRQKPISELNLHTMEVCGLQWNTEAESLASGANDNLVQIWDHRSSKVRYCFEEHEAAVKVYQFNIRR